MTDMWDELFEPHDRWDAERDDDFDDPDDEPEDSEPFEPYIDGEFYDG